MKCLVIAVLTIGCGGAPRDGGTPKSPPHENAGSAVTIAPPNPAPSNEAPMTTFVADGETSIESPPSVSAPPPDAVVSPTGLASKRLRAGNGTQHPGPTDRVRVHYTGWTTDGRMFDSSVTRGRPAAFPLDHVIKGWTEGVQQMVVGEQRRFWIPEELAYGGKKGRPQGMLVFDVELLGFKAESP